MVNNDEKKDRRGGYFDELYNLGRQNVGVYEYNGVESMSMQEVENAANILKNGKVAGINKIMRNY